MVTAHPVDALAGTPRPFRGSAPRGSLVRSMARGLIAAGLLSASPAFAQDIHQAIRSGDVQQVRAILEKDEAAVRVRRFGVYPLHLAARLGNRTIAEMLIARGADIDQFGAEAAEFSPYEFTPLTEAIRTGNMDMIRLFVEKGARLDRVTSYGESYLHFAVITNQKEAAAFLIDRGIDVNLRKRGGLRPLHLAAVMGFDEMAEMLMERGARLDVRSTDGATPLHFAESAGRTKTAALLRSKGARDLPRRFRRYAGAYLGVKGPGSRPQPFAPELFRDIYRAHSTPAFSPDGREVYWECIFMRGNNDASRIWFMKEEDGRWTPPRVAPFSTYPSGGPAFFPDGKSLVYHSRQPRDRSDRPAGDADLWIVEREGDRWGTPRRLDTPLNRDGSDEVLPVVAEDGSIYLNQFSPPTFSRELVKSAFVDGRYAEVETIGDLFETTAVDPCRAMEHILTFSDRGRPDRFEHEIYVSFHGPDGRWSKPVRMADRLHPRRRATQAIVTLDGKYLFFTSDFYIEWVEARILDEFRPPSRQ